LIDAEEQIAESAAHEDGGFDAPTVLGAVVEQMAALAERAQVAGPRVARVVVEMGGGEHHAGLLEVAILAVGRPSDCPAPAIAPGLVLVIEPAAVAEVVLALALLPLPARMVFRTSGLTPACRPRRAMCNPGVWAQAAACSSAS
jgi:hypothetical protein